MPKYMLLIYTPAEERPSPEEAQAEMPRWDEYGKAPREADALVAGEPLEPTETATTVRVRDGETVIADGPFAETKEALTGYYVIEDPDLEAAQKWAARIPSAPRGSIEVRPLMVIPSEDEAAPTYAGAES
jgi:hypothetical protein